MEQDENTPFPREPWQRLLQDRAAAPPETTDARIRASARRPLAHRAARWWLPASLAASFLLAVLVVHRQYGDSEPPAGVTEPDFAAPAAIRPPADGDSSRAASGSAAESAPARQKGAESDGTEDETAMADFAAEPDAEESLHGVTVTGSRTGGPEQELKAASEAESVEPGQVEPDIPEAPTPVTGVTAGEARERELEDNVKRDADPGANFSAIAAKVRTPEAWYAEIEELHAQGRVEEADRELERLKAAHPEWLKRHLEELKRR